MTKKVKTNLGDAVFTDIDANPYLQELYANILYNYSIRLFGEHSEPMCVDVEDALRFADILSKSTDPLKADKHKIWAQEIVALMRALEPQHPAVDFYMDTVLSSTGNYQGLKILEPAVDTTELALMPKRVLRTLLENTYVEFSKELVIVPAEPDKHFFRSQKQVYDRLNEPYFSYSGPTSMGKSFIMRMFIKERVQEGAALNFVVVVPTKALINEVSSKIINELGGLLQEKNYRVVTSAGALALEEEHNFIFVLTPERLLYLLIKYEKLTFNYVFIDEAHKISTSDKRHVFYFKIIDMLEQRESRPHISFASPNIPNPEVYLGLIPGVGEPDLHKQATLFSPVSQVKYFIDCVGCKVKLYNDHTKDGLMEICVAPPASQFMNFMKRICGNSQILIYFNNKEKTVDAALTYAKDLPAKNDPDLTALANEIRAQIHKEYFLADLITKGVAYHIGHLPAAIRQQIEKLYRERKINALFCTSTLVEGVNLPADNLFITTYQKGPRRQRMSEVDFRNLVGRVGRIEFNLYGNVFLVRLEESITEKGYMDLLKNDVPQQTLLLDKELNDRTKELIIMCLAKGDVELTELMKAKEDEKLKMPPYEIVRKFSHILLRDIMKNRNSKVKNAFTAQLSTEIEAKIKERYNREEVKPDDDINISIDQAKGLDAAIRSGLQYPELSADSQVLYNNVLQFLGDLYRALKWDKYEDKQKLGNRNSLKYFSTLLCQWIKGNGLGSIMVESLFWREKNQHSSYVMINYQKTPYNSRDVKHKNVVISDVLEDIEQVLLFSLANCFLKFSEAYKRIMGDLDNDWYEYVEYGTTNPLSIILQKCGFSRETSDYIKNHRQEYVVYRQNGKPLLKRSLAKCGRMTVEKEVADVMLNIEELFEELGGQQ